MPLGNLLYRNWKVVPCVAQPGELAASPEHGGRVFFEGLTWLLISCSCGAQVSMDPPKQGAHRHACRPAVATEAEVEAEYARCRFCLSLYPLGTAHEQCAPLPPAANCYSCGPAGAAAGFSGSQMGKEPSWRKRCKACVAAGATDRFAPPGPPPRPGELLLEAVSQHDAGAVAQLLRGGADPNHVPQRAGVDRVNAGALHVKLWTVDGHPLPELDPLVPLTPLALVGFRISDCMLTAADLVAFKAVAELLLRAGADPKPAVACMELRYGPRDVTREEEDASEWAGACAAVKAAIYDHGTHNKD